MRRNALLAGLASSLFACSSSSTPPAEQPAADAGPDVGIPDEVAAAPQSCVFQCDTTCVEWTDKYACPSLAAWTAIPHADACPAWDGTSVTATPSACTASAATGDAAKYAGADPDDATITVLPDGRRVQAAGKEWLFTEPDIQPNAPVNVLPVPGTHWLLVVDMGYETHAVRVVDATKIGGGSSPQVSIVDFPIPSTLNTPIAFVAPDLVLVATSDGVVQGLKLDTTSGALTKDDTRSIPLPQSVNDVNKAANWYVGGLALSPDGSKLVVTGVFDRRALVVDLKTSYGKILGSVDIGAGGTFACAFDPNDAAGTHAYATMWGGHALVEIDLTDPAAPKVSQRFTIDKNPQGMAFLGARFLVVANDMGDSLALVDRTGGTVTAIPADVAGALPGAEPSNLAYDATNKRLYATLAGANAVAAWAVDDSTTPPTLTPSGRLPTSWWPSSVAVTADGSVAITSMRGHSNGPLDQQYPPDDGDSMHGVKGAIQLVATPSAADLTAGEAKVKSFDDVGALAGAPTVTCPNGENDFPLPPTNTQGPSKKIEHVIFVLRENKTFDGVLGDLPTVNGDPKLALKQSPADMDKLWLNFRNLVRAFATSDDYYTDAELSNQGHTWTTFGRETDFDERTWALNGYSRNLWTSPIQPQGTSDIGDPMEGSLFAWLQKQNVDFDVCGEAEGSPPARADGTSATDVNYPGGFVQDIGYPDVEKACYLAGRARVLCDLPKFVYATFPNDHTQGVSTKQASPELMIATNDEATGMLVDALSHSPMWASTLIVVTEDDPANGGDHVDHHRTPILFASPWIKHGYVSKQHLDVSSIHKMIANILGVPYANTLVEHAALPLDLFTSTPDFTPYTYTPRAWPATCGTKATRAELRLKESWDMSRYDDQPGLDAQVARYLRGEQLEELTPALERGVQMRLARMAERKTAK